VAGAKWDGETASATAGDIKLLRGGGENRTVGFNLTGFRLKAAGPLAGVCMIGGVPQ
jgi:hypothetical protein